MFRKLMRTTVAVAGLAALLLAGACSSNSGLGDDTDVSDQVVQVRPEETGTESTVAPAPGPAVVDSDGNVYASSSAPGTGNPSTVGTNTNVNIVADKPAQTSVTYTEQAQLTPPATPTTPTTVVETPAPIVTETTTTVPMTSAVDEEPEPVRERLRKD